MILLPFSLFETTVEQSNNTALDIAPLINLIFAEISVGKKSTFLMCTFMNNIRIVPFFFSFFPADTPVPFVKILESIKIALTFLNKFITGVAIIGTHAAAPIILNTNAQSIITTPSSPSWGLWIANIYLKLAAQRCRRSESGTGGRHGAAGV